MKKVYLALVLLLCSASLRAQSPNNPNQMCTLWGIPNQQCTMPDTVLTNYQLEGHVSKLASIGSPTVYTYWFVSDCESATACSTGSGGYLNLLTASGSTGGTWSVALNLAPQTGGGGSSGLSSFSTGNLIPLFTASLGANPTTTPALAFTLSTAGQNAVFAGPASGGTGAPSYRTLTSADISPAGTLPNNISGQAATVPASGVQTGALPSGVTIAGSQVSSAVANATQASTVATINGLIIQGGNIAITGSGTPVSPYSIADSSGYLGAVVDTGTANAYVVSLPASPTYTGDVFGVTFDVRLVNASTGVSTITINGGTPRQLQIGFGSGAGTTSGYIAANGIYHAFDNGVAIIITPIQSPVEFLDTTFSLAHNTQNTSQFGIGLANVPASTKIMGYVPPATGTFVFGNSETIASSATPTFTTAYLQSYNILTANVTSFTLAAGYDGQPKTLTFCQNSTGGFTVTPPSNVHGFFTVGTNASKCSSQTYTYSTAQVAWLADSPGVINE